MPVSVCDRLMAVILGGLVTVVQFTTNESRHGGRRCSLAIPAAGLAEAGHSNGEDKQAPDRAVRRRQNGLKCRRSPYGEIRCCCVHPSVH